MKARPLCLSDAIEQYLQYRNQLGFALKTEARALRNLGRYAEEVGHAGALTRELAIHWVQLPASASPLWWARRLDMVRRFARFWVALDADTQVPPPGLFGPAYQRSPVHIYTATEVTALLEATDILIPVGQIQALTFKTFLGLLACTGMRVSEALRLQDEDFSWTNATVTIRRSKFGRSRCLPLHASAIAQLRSYQKQRQNTHRCPLKPAFFLPLNGRPLSYSQAGKMFRRLRAHLGWKQTPGPRNDLILLQVRPDRAAYDWKPVHAFNLTSDRTIPYSTYGKFVVDTATSLGQQGDKGFFKQQAQTHIAHALEALYETQSAVTLDRVYEILLSEPSASEIIQNLQEEYPTSRRQALLTHFSDRFRKQPPEQMGGVKETIANYLQGFLTPDIAEVFCPKRNTFEFNEIDRGKIICVAMPQKYQAERRYVNTFLKMLFYTHVLRRFDKPKEQRKDDNLLILWADEAQRFMTSSEEGMSDYNSIDVIREAQATIVAAAQSSTSFIPPLGREKAKVLTLNLRNRMIFKAADEEGAVESADFLGKKKIIKKSWGFTAGKRTRNYSEQEEHHIKPYILRNLKKHTCVLVHCEKGFRKRTIPPIEPNGSVCSWFGNP